MTNLLAKILQRLSGLDRGMRRMERMDAKVDRLLRMEARRAAAANRERGIVDDLSLTEFSVYSQAGDDGIIQYLIDHIEIGEQTFIEFGVEDYSEANTRFLLENNLWRGFIMDGSTRNIDKIRAEEFYWKFDLSARAAFITAENINDLIREAGFTGDLGLLHVDIDGNDYWVWKALDVVSPRIAVLEYNSVFGAEHALTVPYDPKFTRTGAHHSNLYYGASLPALCRLAEEKGYAFVGCNSFGNNAYFVRRDVLGPLKEKSPREGYVLSAFRESRDEKGRLTFARGDERAELIRGLPVHDLSTGETRPF